MICAPLFRAPPASGFAMSAPGRWLRGLAHLGLPCALALAGAPGQAYDREAAALEVAWRDPANGAVVWHALDEEGRDLPGRPSPQPVPLGSLWKLFVFAWEVEQGRASPDYVCRGAQGGGDAARALREQEIYCCEPGGRIGREAALVASCGAFFAPSRLAIDADAWRAFWSARAPAEAWLADLAAMRAETQVTPANVIAALEAVPPRARAAASRVLLARAFGPGGDAGGLVRQFGGTLRVKTFSWFHADTRQRIGGAAGWLTDGTPVWFAANGSGQQVLAQHAARLAAILPSSTASLLPGCVEVEFFARYPLLRVQGPDGRPAKAGPLRGQHVAVFERGVSLPFLATGELRLAESAQRPVVFGRFGIDDYIARVLDREAHAGETEAARALAVVARSYLFNEARSAGNCLHIADSSRTQRVSPNPPTPAARAIAAFTTDLVLRGAPVGYHFDTPAEHRLAWTQAVDATRGGARWDEILRSAFPHADLVAADDPAGLPCQRIAKAERWLAARAAGWSRQLHALPGFSPPPPPQVCQLRHGRPFAELDRGRIHVRDLASREDRITLAHEYLHLGLRHHPAASNESLVESWARRLVDEVSP